MDESLETWFQNEILPHEPSLVRFLSRTRLSPMDVQDLRHDIYVRILDAAARERPIAPKPYLFSVARRLLIDRARRRRVVAIDSLADLDVLNVLVDEVSSERWATGREQVQRLAILFDRLPLRCRQVVWMRRVDELPQKEIAARLGIAEATVEKHLMRGIRMLTDALFGERSVKEPERVRETSEGKHGG